MAGGSLGELYYDILPDINVGAFTAKINAALGGLNAKPIKIKVEADTAGAQKTTAAAQRSAAAQTAARAKVTAATERAVAREIAAADRLSARAAAAAQRSAQQAERAQQRVVAATERAAQQEARASDRLASKRKADIGAGVEQAGRVALVAGAAIGVGVGLAVRASANFEQSMSNVASTGKYTSDQLGLLSKVAIEQGQATKYSATEAADGEAELVKAGLSLKDVVNGGLKGALNLAAAGNLSVADSASAAATAINQFGLQGEDATHVADRFVQIAGIAQGETSDVAEAFKNGAVTAHQYGLNIDDASTVLAAFAENGITGAQAGTLLKSSLTNLYAPTGRVKTELDKLGVSAYDASGNAKSVTEVSENLNQALAGLDAQARNNALARIFGKETLQGGAILASEGAAGLNKIRAELDQFPTAAETAATKMDNLKGDVEQLTGSLETGLIKSGSGANGFLRDLAQGAKGAVDGFTGLPAAVQKGALGVAAFSSAGLLAFSGAVKLASGIATAKTALDAMADSGSRVPSALGKVGRAAAIAGAAVSAAFAVGAGFDSIFRKGDPTLSDAGQALGQLGQAAGGAAPLMNKFFDSTGKKYNDIGPVTADIHNLGDALKRVTDPTRGQKVNDFISGWLPGKDQLETVKGQFGQLDQTLASLGTTSAPQAAAGFAEIAKTAADQKVPVEDLVKLFPQYKQQLQDQATALGVTVPDSAQVYADWMGGKVPDALVQFAQAHPDATGATALLGQAQDHTTDTLNTAAAALQNLVKPQKISADGAAKLATSIFGAGQAAISASGAQIAYAQAVQQAAKAGGGGIDPKTQKGASNLSLLNQQASAYQRVAAAQISAGKSAGSVAAGTQKARDSFIDNAKAMGVSSGKAKDLADKYGLIPKNVKTKIEAQVQADAATQISQLKSLDGTIITPKVQALIDQGKYKQALTAVHDLQKDRRAKIKAEAANTPEAKAKLDAAAKTRAAKLKAQAEGVDKANGSINRAARDRSSTIHVATSGLGAAASAIAGVAKDAYKTIFVKEKKTSATGGTMTPIRRSNGGSVWGAGTATSDSIDAMLSNGEEVIRTKQANINRAALKTINAGGAWDVVPRRGGRVASVGYRDGGTVSAPSSSRGGDVVVYVDLGSELGGIRRIVAQEIAADGEYRATLTRMGHH